jgi:ankyrin repeat protein
MAMILDKNTSETAILLMLQQLKMSEEIRAQEIATSTDPKCRHGTLFHAASIAGRIGIATQLLRYGADPEAKNYDNQTPLDLALKHKQVAMTKFLDPTSASASVELEPAYAKDERDLVWAQRKRRRNLERQLQGAKLSLNEEAGARLALEANDREEWMHLEGTYLSRGLASDTIDDFKSRRSMH